MSENQDRFDYGCVDSILAARGTSTSACLQILQDLQNEFGYLPHPAIQYVVRNSDISARQIYGVASFYGQFRFLPAGRYLIRVCEGTACHVNGAERVLDYVAKELEIANRQTTPDGLFTLECVACLGCCSLAPVMMINDIVFGHLTSSKIKKILVEYRNEQRVVEEKEDVNV